HRARRRAATSRGPALRRCAAQPDYPVATAESQPVWPLLLRFGADAPGWRSTGGSPVGTVSFRTRWSLTEVFGWMWLARGSWLPPALSRSGGDKRGHSAGDGSRAGVR